VEPGYNLGGINGDPEVNSADKIDLPSNLVLEEERHAAEWRGA
jgi:hypothetical protein